MSSTVFKIQMDDFAALVRIIGRVSELKIEWAILRV
jgi:hypothetical protein